MSVIIRLQNLPWSANALDIRQFFKGLSIPEGGVHIVGGEMGDAFIAFSTDEDARQAMMQDRGKLNEVQVRLLLSSRAEMQKVIETARQQSLLALQKAAAMPIAAAPVAATASTATAASSKSLATPQPPVITTNSLQNLLASQLGGPAPSFQTYQQQAGITLMGMQPTAKQDNSGGGGGDGMAAASSRPPQSSSVDSTRDRSRRSTSRDRRRSRSRDRNRRRRDRSSTRSRERDRRNGRNRSSRRSRSRDRSRERSRDSNRNGGRNNRNSRDCDNPSGVGGGNRFGREGPQRSGDKNQNVGDVMDITKPAAVNPWSVAPINAYETNLNSQGHASLFGGQVQRVNPLNAFGSASGIPNAYTSTSTASARAEGDAMGGPTGKVPSMPAFQHYSTTTNTTNNYSVNFVANPLAAVAAANSNSESGPKPFALQNPYTAALQAAVSNSSNSNSQDSNSSSVFSGKLSAQQQPQGKAVFPGLILDKRPDEQQTGNIGGQQSGQGNLQQPIAFANTNPYAQMYPSLFAQAASTGSALPGGARGSPQSSASNMQEQPQRTGTGASQEDRLAGGSGKNNGSKEGDGAQSCSIRISNMCTSTTYSDIRKFFSGLFIPHNGIKMVNDRNGVRTGVAFIQFSRQSCIAKAMVRNNTMFKSKRIHLDIVSDQEFKDIEDSYRPQRFDRGSDGLGGGEDAGSASSGIRGVYEKGNDNSQERPPQGHDHSGPAEPFSVLYIEDIPPLATEQDIMKMFSAYTIYDILLTISPENRREFTAYVKFSREEEAKSAMAETSRHIIGHRKVRIRPAKNEDMERAKEKLRLANEQLKKEEQEQIEAEDRERRAAANRNNRDGNDDNADRVRNYADIHRDRERDNRNDDLLGGPPNIPSIFDLPSSNPDGLENNIDTPSDPRLRRQRKNRFQDIGSNNDRVDRNMDLLQVANQAPNFNLPPNFNSLFQVNPMEKNFVMLKNCDYNTRIHDVAEFLMSFNLSLRHVEPLVNDRNMPSGEFIVEFTNPEDAERSVSRLNNTQFRMRNLRVRSITPQEIADRIGKPFMNYLPGGAGGPSPTKRGNFDFSGRGGTVDAMVNAGASNMSNNIRMNGGRGNGEDLNMGSRFGNNSSNNNSNNDNKNSNRVRSRNGGSGGGGGGGGASQKRSGSGGRGGKRRNRNNKASDLVDGVPQMEAESIRNSDNDELVSNHSTGGGANSGGNGIPEKFNRPGCVIAMENVPFKADLNDIMEFFGEYGIFPDDIIRRFNDDGTPTGDARVAFANPAIARAAFEGRKQRTIFNRTIYLEIL